VSPTILRILKQISSRDFQKAAKDDVDLVATINAHKDTKESFVVILKMVPFAWKVSEYMTPKYIDMFIEKAIAGERPDLYAVMKYYPYARKWFYRQMEGIKSEISSWRSG